MTPGVPVLVPRFGNAEVNVVVETSKMSFPAERRIRFFTNPQIPGLDGVVRFTRVPAGASDDGSSGSAGSSQFSDRNLTSDAEPRSILEPATGASMNNKDQ